MVKSYPQKYQIPVNFDRHCTTATVEPNSKSEDKKILRSMEKKYGKKNHTKTS